MTQDLVVWGIIVLAVVFLVLRFRAPRKAKPNRKPDVTLGALRRSAKKQRELKDEGVS